MDLDYDMEMLGGLESVMTSDDIDKMRSHVRAIPLPDYMTPSGGVPLSNLDDETLLTAPPHMIAHMQRTASQGGLQVISPRQVPFSYLMRRVPGSRAQLGDHKVGSVADPDAEWPTIDGESVDHWLPDEPLPASGASRAHRSKTRTVSLTTSTYDLADPILACLVKGRAVVDILRRDDVQGGSDEFTQLLASAWGVEKREIDEMDAYTLGVDGPLLRHAIKADDVYSTIYAPVHIRRCISVGCTEVTRSLLPGDSAMDWRRMRVFCEAVFALTVSIEGLPIKLMRAMPPPGDLSARGDRPGIMTFQPSPAIAWSYEATSFSLFPLPPEKNIKCSAIPREVIDALSRYVDSVRPVSHMLAEGAHLAAKRSVTQKVEMPMGETITSSYRLMVQSVSLGAARGRFAASTMRNTIYDAMSDAPPLLRLRLSRYIDIALKECKEHLGLKVVPDSMIIRIADRFLDIGSMIRNRVAAEAARRGDTVEIWWSDILAQAPRRYEDFAEGTRGWAVVGMWLMFRCPTERWKNLAHAVKFSALKSAEVKAVGSIPLPAKKGSEQRLLVAARAAVAGITKAYSGYYMGVHDVGLALADVADDQGKTRSAMVLREAAYLWSMRARALRGTNIDLIAKSKLTPNQNYLRIPGPKVDLLLVPVPYRGYSAYQAHVAQSELLPKLYKTHIAEELVGPVSKVFTNWGREIYRVKETTLTRYLNDGPRLGSDMEKAWSELVSDMKRLMNIYGHEEEVKSRSPSPVPKKIRKVEPSFIFSLENYEPKPRHDFWTISAQLGDDRFDWVEDALTQLGPGIEAEFYEGTYEDTEDLMRRVTSLMDGLADQSRLDSETVR